ncbi:tryptophan synthase subunit alpha [Streptomyces canus]|uniref:tryptophan synthase subunit alpha n=1 Tax=Streptomyces canus TaxID=58343 RepID=UPI003409FDEC
MITSTVPSGPAARLDHVLATSRAQQRAALGLYLPVNYPTRSASREALHAIAAHADLVELGVPHHQPHLDGPVIQQAVAQALTGFQMRDLFASTAELAAHSTAALLVMSYWEPIRAFGATAFAHMLADAGGAGALIPDLPPAAAPQWRAAAEAAGLHTVNLAPPHASGARLAELGKSTTGMLYAAATPGLTGARRPLSPYLPSQVRRLREGTGLPVAVGIGISTPQQASRVSLFADAAVIGSAVIRRMQASPNAPAAAAAAAACDFAQAVRHAPAHAA